MTTTTRPRSVLLLCLFSFPAALGCDGPPETAPSSDDHAGIQAKLLYEKRVPERRLEMTNRTFSIDRLSAFACGAPLLALVLGAFIGVA